MLAVGSLYWPTLSVTNMTTDMSVENVQPYAVALKHINLIRTMCIKI